MDGRRLQRPGQVLGRDRGRPGHLLLADGAVTHQVGKEEHPDVVDRVPAAPGVEVTHLAGVREDVTDIVLNVKQIALKMEGEGPKRLQLSADSAPRATWRKPLSRRLSSMRDRTRS